MAAAARGVIRGIARKLMEDGVAKGGKTAGTGRPKNGDPGRAPSTRTKAGKPFAVGEKAVDTPSARSGRDPSRGPPWTVRPRLVE